MPATNPGTTNLVAWWALDEASGNRADSHTGGYTLTDANTVGSVAGKVGTAASFTAADSDYLYNATTATWQLFDDAASWSVCGWWRQDDTDQQACWAHDYNGFRAPHLLWKGTYFQLEWFDGTGSARRVDAGSGLSTSTWYFVACGYDHATTDIWASLNGGAKGTLDVSAYSFDTITANFALGRWLKGALYQDGDADEVAVFNDTLSADELTWLYNSGSGRSYADLTASAGNPLGLFAAQQRAMYAYGGVSVG